MTSKLICLTLCLLFITSCLGQLQFTPETRARFEQFIHDSMAHPYDNIDSVKQVSEFLGNQERNTISDTRANLLQFAQGFLEGIGSDSVFDIIKTCIADSEEVFNELNAGITDISTKDPAKVKEGLELLGEVVQIIPTAVKTCEVSGANLQILLKMIEAFKTPESFFYHVGKSLVINHVEVYHEIRKAVSAYEAHDYNQLGYYVGKTMDTIILGPDQPLSQSYADYLNEVSGWKAGIPAKFEGMTAEEIKHQFLGTEKVDYSKIENITEYNYEGLINDIPSYFNSSEQWPGCVHPIRDQQKCGSCWAFAASEVLSDRLCIASQGKINVVLSPQDLVSCNNILNKGCNGGVPLYAWWYMERDGLVTDDCLPYQSGNGTNPVTCLSFTKCQDGTPKKKYYGTKKSVVKLTDKESIQANILQYGPVQVSMEVFVSFYYYTGGIYVNTGGKYEGSHSVKIIGWGNENGTDYWIVANSWGTSWGENGFFRIQMGQCGVDTGGIAGLADITRSGLTIEEEWWMN